jgi:hypothetical protein
MVFQQIAAPADAEATLQSPGLGMVLAPIWQ